MSVLSSLKSRVPLREKSPDMSSFRPQDLIPDDKQQIVDKMPEELGVTMTYGALLDAIHNASRALIIQREYPDSEEIIAQAQELIDLSMRDLGHRSQQVGDIHHVPKPHAEMAQAVLGEISLIIDESYGLGDQKDEAAVQSPAIGPISANRPISDSSIAA